MDWERRGVASDGEAVAGREEFWKVVREEDVGAEEKVEEEVGKGESEDGENDVEENAVDVGSGGGADEAVDELPAAALAGLVNANSEEILPITAPVFDCVKG